MPCAKSEPFTEKDVPRMDGYVILITGGNSGVGYETTKSLALKGARVYIAGRSKERVEKAMAKMREEAEGQELDLHFLHLDLEDLQSAKRAGEEFLTRESKLDVLINNAGIMTTPYALTKDGFERQWQCHFLSPFVFTMGVMPALEAAAAQAGSDKGRVRVVCLGSDAATYGPKAIQWDDVNMKDTTGFMETWMRYGQSKQAILRFSRELNDRYSAKGITGYCVHPGVIKTGLQDHDPTMLGTMTRFLVNYIQTTTPVEGARNSLFCASSPQAPGLAAGKFVLPVGKVTSKVDSWLEDKENNKRLWELGEAQIAAL